MQPLTLALGGGGVKCAAQAGVLAVLEEENIPLGPLVGCSGGGLVAVLYGAGLSPQAIREFLHDIHLLEAWEPNPAARALFSITTIRQQLHDVLGDRTFADLRHPVAALSFDMRSYQPVFITEGLLSDAVIATMAIPGLLPGIMTEDQWLVDGGLAEIIPVTWARRLAHTAPVVALDVLRHVAPAQENENIVEERGAMVSVLQFSRQFQITTMLGAVYETLRIMMNRQAELITRLNPPDLLVCPPVGHIGLFAFDEARHAYQAGVNTARDLLPDLRRLAGLPPSPV